MGVFEGCLFITDMDGTLLRSDGTVSKRTLDTINHFISEGGYFTISTGRPKNGALPAIKDLPINAPIVCFNGAMIYDKFKNQTIYAEYLPKGMTTVIEDIIEAFPVVGVEGFNEEEACIFKNSEKTIFHFEVLKEKINIVSTDIIEDKNWLKMFVTGENSEIMTVMKYLNDKYPNAYSIVPSRPIFLEIFSNKCDKGRALNILKNHLGATRTFASGDNYNDIPMVVAADIGIVVANAEEELKKQANMLVPSNDEDGLAIALEKIEKDIREKRI